MRTDKTTMAADLLVFFAFGRIFNNARPGFNRIHAEPGLTPHFQQTLTYFWEFQTVGTVQIPGVTGTTGTATGLMVG